MAKGLGVGDGLVVLVDDDVWEWASGLNWFMRNGYPCRYVPGTAYGTGDYRERYLHHDVAGKADQGHRSHVHHKDENPLNCQRENLIVMTPKQHRIEHAKSAAYTTAKLHEAPRRRKDGSLGYKGVAWHSRLGGWQVSLAVNGRNVFLGRYSDPEEAALVYDAAVLYYRGGEGYTNLIPTAG